MRTFIGTTRKATVSRTYGGSNVIASVVEMIDNEPKFVCEVKWCTRGYKGEESEIMNELARKGIIEDNYKSGYYKRDKPELKIFWLG